MPDGNKNLKTEIEMKTIIKIIILPALLVAAAGCNPYEDYIKDYDYTGVYFGAQQPLRTLVSRGDKDSLEFRIGVALGGLRENTKGYSAEFTVDPTLLTTVSGADVFTLLPVSCYDIISADNTFFVPPGKFLGDCPVRINKNDFANLPGSLQDTYALPLRLVSTTADSITSGKDYTVIVIKYIDEHSGSYYVKGWRAEWNGTDTLHTVRYSEVDLSKNKVRSLTTISLTQFDMAGVTADLGYTTADPAAADHLLINLNQGVATLQTKAGCNAVAFREASYNPGTKTFTLNYLYTRNGIQYLINEDLVLRQDVEEGLRFQTWPESAN